MTFSLKNTFLKPSFNLRASGFQTKSPLHAIRLGLLSLGLTAFALSLSFIAKPAFAQNAIALANDEAITSVDLNNRIQLSILSSGIAPRKETEEKIRTQTLEQLINETLQLQTARKQGIKITQSQLRDSFENLAQRNGLTGELFRKRLSDGGLDPRVLERQIAAQMVWPLILRRRIGDQIIFSEEDLKKHLEQIEQQRGETEYYVSELFIGFDNSRDQAGARSFTQQLATQAKEGKVPFPALASQFSQASTALEGGRLGWIIQGELEPNLDRALRGAKQGDIIGPISTARGYTLFYINDTREVGTSYVRKMIGVKQLFVALPQEISDPKDIEKAQKFLELAQSIKGCDAMDRAIKDIGEETSGDFANQPEIPERALPAQLKEVTNQLEVGQASEPIRTPDGALLFMVCKRFTDKKEISEEEVRNEEISKRLSAASKRYIRELRKKSNIKYFN